MDIGASCEYSAIIIADYFFCDYIHIKATNTTEYEERKKSNIYKTKSYILLYYIIIL